MIFIASQVILCVFRLWETPLILERMDRWCRIFRINSVFMDNVTFKMKCYDFFIRASDLWILHIQHLNMISKHPLKIIKVEWSVIFWYIDADDGTVYSVYHRDNATNTTLDSPAEVHDYLTTLYLSDETNWYQRKRFTVDLKVFGRSDCI